MSSDDRMPPTVEVFVRYTNTEGKTHVARHWCWDKELFLAARRNEQGELNLDARKKGEPAKAAANEITKAEYEEEK